jgi:hypothetical protein
MDGRAFDFCVSRGAGTLQLMGGVRPSLSFLHITSHYGYGTAWNGWRIGNLALVR